MTYDVLMGTLKPTNSLTPVAQFLQMQVESENNKFLAAQKQFIWFYSLYLMTLCLTYV